MEGWLIHSGQCCQGFELCLLKEKGLALEKRENPKEETLAMEIWRGGGEREREEEKVIIQKGSTTNTGCKGQRDIGLKNLERNIQIYTQDVSQQFTERKREKQKNIFCMAVSVCQYGNIHASAWVKVQFDLYRST